MYQPNNLFQLNYDNLDSSELVKEAKKNLNTAKLILSQNNLLSKLDGDDLIDIASTNIEYANFILNDKNITNRMDASDLWGLGKKDFKFTKLIFQDDELMEKMNVQPDDSDHDAPTYFEDLTNYYQDELLKSGIAKLKNN